MKRREFIKSLGYAAVWSLPTQLITVASLTATWGQAQEKMRRVGVLFSELSSDPTARPVLQALVNGLREHGWEEGRKVVLEVRYAGPDPARFPELAAELGALKVDVIMAASSEAINAARRKAPEIPIVMAGAGLPVRLDLVSPRLQALQCHKGRGQQSRHAERQGPEGYVGALVEGGLAGTTAEQDRTQHRLKVAEGHGTDDTARHREPGVAIASANLGEHRAGTGARDGDAGP
jgi:hypothetical protein